ncbi:MAG: sulfate transporter [bacterium]|nr:MAG: sulfate transporter [bacterium]
MKGVLRQLLPFMSWFPKITRETAKSDLMAGITGAVVVLPQSVAFAAIAGMPPEYGLYAAMVPTIIAALFGSSWHLVTGPTTAVSIILLSSLSGLPNIEPMTAKYVAYALTLTFLVGVIEITMGLARLGALVNFISHSVITGFVTGAAILIAAKQIKHFFGLAIPGELHIHEIFFYLFNHFDEIKLYVVLVGLLTLLSGILTKRYFPKIPYMIVSILIGTIGSVLLNQYIGQGVTGIITIKAIPASLPPFSSPVFSLDVLAELTPVAFAVTILALTEAISITRALAATSGQRVDGNQEFIGQGLANIMGSFFSSYVATGSFNRSSVNYAAGAKTPIAALTAGGLLILIVLIVAPWTKYLPNAAMAGILFLVAWGLMDFHQIKKIIRASRSEAVILLVTFLATLFLELQFAILLGVILSLMVYLSKTSHPKILVRAPDPSLPGRRLDTNPSLPECPQFKIIRIDGSLFFGAVTYVLEQLLKLLEENPEQKHLLIVANGMNFVDIAGAELLSNLAQRLRKDGGDLYLCKVKPGVHNQLVRGGFIDEIGKGNIFQTKSDAIKSIYDKLDQKICDHCDKKIFNECHVTG